MQTKHLCVLIYIYTKGEVGAMKLIKALLLNILTDCFLWIIHVISVLCLLCFCARLVITALWSPSGQGLTSWLSFVMSKAEVK